MKTGNRKSRHALLPFYLFILIVLSACGQKGSIFQLNGKFKNINQGEFYIYSMESGRKDTIALRDGQFNYNTELRDSCVLILMFPNYSELPIIATPGDKVKMTGDVSHLKETKITGTDENDEMTAFRLLTNDMIPPKVKEEAERFINENPRSPACLYLLRRYFLQSVEPDYDKAHQLCKKLLEARPGNVQLIQQYHKLTAVSQLQSTGPLPTFSAKDTEGKTVDNSLLKDKIGVIMVWATWSYDSQSELQKVKTFCNKHARETQLISICMDATPQEGRHVLINDSVKWPNICDGRMWDSPLIEKLSIAHIPDNIVVDKQGKIAGRNLRNVVLMKELESLLDK